MKTSSRRVTTCGSTAWIFYQRAFASADTAYLLGIKRQCLDLGLPIGHLGVAFAGDDDFRRAKIEEAKSAVDIALVLGAPLIRVFGWHTSETEGHDPMFAVLGCCLREVCDYGKEKRWRSLNNETQRR